MEYDIHVFAGMADGLQVSDIRVNGLHVAQTGDEIVLSSHHSADLVSPFEEVFDEVGSKEAIGSGDKRANQGCSRIR